jgi:hypothetical protein
VRKLLTVLVAALVAGIVAVAPAGAGENGPLRLGAHMTGDRVVPLGGDPDGRGRAHLRANLSENELCFRIDLINVSEVTEGHIHMGQVGEVGDVVVNLHLEEVGQVACIPVGRATLRRIVQNPQAFYMDIHTTEHPITGAIRDQLSQRT